MKNVSAYMPLLHNGKTGHLPEMSKADLLAQFERVGQIAVKRLEKERAVIKKTKLLNQTASLLAEKNANANPIPSRYTDAKLVDLDNLEDFGQINRDLIDAYVRLFASNQGEGIIFWGNVGAGKTHTACAIANALTETNQYTVFYTNVTEIIANVVSSKSFNNGKNEYDVINGYKSPDLLIIDDIGLKQLTQTEIGVISSVIDVRSRNKRPIIAISNLSVERFGLAIGEMAASRITGHNSTAIQFEGIDIRKHGIPASRPVIETERTQPELVIEAKKQFKRIDIDASDGVDWT